MTAIHVRGIANGCPGQARGPVPTDSSSSRIGAKGRIKSLIRPRREGQTGHIESALRYKRSFLSRVLPSAAAQGEGEGVRGLGAIQGEGYKIPSSRVGPARPKGEPGRIEGAQAEQAPLRYRVLGAHLLVQERILEVLDGAVELGVLLLLIGVLRLAGLRVTGAFVFFLLPFFLRRARTKTGNPLQLRFSL